MSSAQHGPTPYQTANRIMSEFGTSIEHATGMIYRTSDNMIDSDRMSLSEALYAAGVVVVRGNAPNRVYVEIPYSE
jgi:hypothetical protein